MCGTLFSKKNKKPNQGGPSEGGLALKMACTPCDPFCVNSASAVFDSGGGPGGGAPCLGQKLAGKRVFRRARGNFSSTRGLFPAAIFGFPGATYPPSPLRGATHANPYSAPLQGVDLYPHAARNTWNWVIPAVDLPLYACCSLRDGILAIGPVGL